MTQEKVMIGGKELRVGCVVKDADGYYFKILCFGKNRFSQTKYRRTPEEAEKDNEPVFTRDYSQDLEIISYPILGQDKNGDDVRLFDNINAFGIIYTVVGLTGQYFILNFPTNSDNRNFSQIDNCTLVKQPKTLIGKTATVTIDGKSYKVEVKEEVR